MAIQKQFVLRYREEGHLRFEIPIQFCDPLIADALTDKLKSIDGVYRVKVYRGQKKLSVRYQETVCDSKTLAKQLYQIIADLEKEAEQIVRSGATGKIKSDRRRKEKLKRSKVSLWFSSKYDEAKETLQAAKILTTRGLKGQKKFFNDPEKALIDFLNDILVLFLIRLHWDQITKEWIPKPIKYRYEWMAIFYMIFLLMRSRKPK